MLYKSSNNCLVEIIGQLLSNSLLVIEECEGDELIILYGIIIIQSIIVYYQQIYDQNLFSIEWTRNFLKLILNLIKNTKDKNLLKILIKNSFENECLLLKTLLDQLFEQITSKNSFKFFDYQFEIPQTKTNFNFQWFLSKHKNIQLNFNDFPSKQNSFESNFNLFSEKLNKLWHENCLNLELTFNISFIHDQINLLKERLPPLLILPNINDFKQDLINIALYQVIDLLKRILISFFFSF